MSGIDFEVSKIIKEIRKKYSVKYGVEDDNFTIKCDDCQTLKRIVLDLIQQLAECRFKPSGTQGTGQNNRSHSGKMKNQKHKIPEDVNVV